MISSSMPLDVFPDIAVVALPESNIAPEKWWLGTKKEHTQTKKVRKNRYSTVGLG